MHLKSVLLVPMLSALVSGGLDCLLAVSGMPLSAVAIIYNLFCLCQCFLLWLVAGLIAFWLQMACLLQLCIHLQSVLLGPMFSALLRSRQSHAYAWHACCAVCRAVLPCMA